MYNKVLCKLQKLMLAMRKKKKEILAGWQGLKETMGCLAIRWKRARMKTVLKTGSRIHDYGSSYSLGIIPFELNEMPTFWSLCSSPQGSKSRERKSNWTNADYSQKWWQYFSLPSTHTFSKLTLLFLPSKHGVYLLLGHLDLAVWLALVSETSANVTQTGFTRTCVLGLPLWARVGTLSL